MRDGAALYGLRQLDAGLPLWNYPVDLAPILIF
jgi:hypothetical protein